MDLDKIYETVVLRDILEYTFPGSIVITSGMIILDTVCNQLGIDYSFFADLGEIPLWQILALLALSYLMGHVLTAFDTRFFRDREEKQPRGIIQDNEWLEEKLVKVLSKYTETTTSDMVKLIKESSEKDAPGKKPSFVTTLRELGRAIVHKNQPELYREFVNRHSILSRLCKNMSIALTFFLIALVVSSIIGWNSLFPLFSAHPLLTICIAILVVILIYGTARLLSERARRLRSTMIKHTFQIIYADYIMSRISKNNSNE